MNRFVASGECIDLDLAALTKALDLGVMTGVLRVQIADWTIVDNRLKSADVTLTVADAEDAPNWIEGKLLREIARRLLKFELPPILPERVEYTRLGLRLEVRDEELHVFGSHGEKETTILTARLLGRDIPLVYEPRRSFYLEPVFDDLREKLRLAIEAGLRRAASQPGELPPSAEPRP